MINKHYKGWHYSNTNEYKFHYIDTKKGIRRAFSNISNIYHYFKNKK